MRNILKPSLSLPHTGTVGSGTRFLKDWLQQNDGGWNWWCGSGKGLVDRIFCNSITGWEEDVEPKSPCSP